MTSIASRESAVLWPTYVRAPVEFVRGEGTRLFDADGREYLDFLGGIAVVAAGHANPKVVAAVAGQLATLGHTSNLYFTGPQVDLAERLVDRFGGGAKVFFSNSGAEANEAAIKLARRYGRATKGEQATGIVAAEGGFHGRTLGTLAATGKPAIKQAFEPLPAGFTHVPFGDADALAAAVNQTTAAVLLEPVQGEAGIRVPPDGYLAAARRIADDAGALLILDEVQSGMGRTGTLFAHQRAGVRPDVMTLAKALGNGYPVGATVAGDRAAAVLRPGDHASTFGGNPVACVAAMATLDVVEPLLDGGHVRRVSARLGDGLRALAGRCRPAGQVRGLGLWYALDLGDAALQPGGGQQPAGAKAVAQAALAAGLVVNPVTDTALRLAPPLVVSEEEVDEALARLARALQEAGACP